MEEEDVDTPLLREYVALLGHSNQGEYTRLKQLIKTHFTTRSKPRFNYHQVLLRIHNHL